MKTTKIKSILAYANNDDTRVLKAAANLAEAMRARLTVMDVLEELHMKVMMSTSANLAALVRDAKQERLKKLAARLSASGSKVRIQLLVGQPETAIIREVLKNGHDLLVISSAGEEGRRLTTTGMRLLRKCPCPVWVVGLGRSKRRLRVLAAVDALPGDVPRANLNAKVLALADSVANQCGGELHVLNAWYAYGESMLRGPRFGGRAAEVASYVRQTQIDHSEELVALLKRTGTALPASRVHLLKGDAGEIIPRFCKEEKMVSIP